MRFERSYSFPDDQYRDKGMRSATQRSQDRKDNPERSFSSAKCTRNEQLSTRVSNCDREHLCNLVVQSR